MKLVELNQDEMYVMVAPDGEPQVATLAPEFQMCFAVTKLLANAGYGKTPEELLQEGFVIMPVQVTMTQNGTVEEGFNRAIDALKPVAQDDDEEDTDHIAALTAYNMDLVSQFLEHIKEEAGIEVPESVFVSFFEP